VVRLFGPVGGPAWLADDQGSDEGAKEHERPVRDRLVAADAVAGEHDRDVAGGEQRAGDGGDTTAATL
jgi:hypothetical protein